MSEVPVKHSQAFRTRRFWNWFPLGLTYALLYMGRYNLTVSKNALGELMTKEDFGIIFAAGTIIYALAFLINGPLVDKIGGKKGILIASLGAGTMNLAMGIFLWWILKTGHATSSRIRLVFLVLYPCNMYFQSYGAVSIVKVNAHWFHVRERGGFSGIFGTMISSGIFLAFTVNGWILDFAGKWTSEAKAAVWVFLAPCILLYLFFVIELLLLRDRPSQAGFQDFDTGDASSGEENADIPVLEIMKRIITNPIILTVAFIEFCTGVIRNGIMHWFPIYAKEIWALPPGHYLRHGSWGNTGVVALFFAVALVSFLLGFKAKGRRKAWLFIWGGIVFLLPFLQGGWGGILFAAGVIGANVAGWASDMFFQSRRAPVAGILYTILAISSVGMLFSLGGTTNVVGWARPLKGPFRKGDIIISLNGKETGTWEDVEKVLKESRDHGKVKETGGIETVASRNGKPLKFLLQVNLSPGEIRAWMILPPWAGMDTDRSKPPRIYGIREGDRILSIAQNGREASRMAKEAPFKDWTQVARAVASIPAEGIGKARWNPRKMMCTYDGTGIPQGMEPSSGLIYAVLERNGKTLEIAFRDPLPRMRAGDKRYIAAGPVLTLAPIWLGLIVFVMSICVIGTHGLLSGTATADFGGRKGAATAVGMIDGFVYLGTGFQSLVLGFLTTKDWSLWPVFLFPFGVIGFILLRRIWHAIPKGKGKARRPGEE